MTAQFIIPATAKYLTNFPTNISATVIYGFVRMNPIAIAIKSPIIGNQVSSAAAQPYFSTRLCTFSNFSRFTLKYFSSHFHLQSQPMPKLIIPPAVLPMLATMTITHTL